MEQKQKMKDITALLIVRVSWREKFKRLQEQ